MLGTHAGIANFTIGQRRGIGVSASEPLYVLDIDPGTHRVTVGPRSALERPAFRGTDVNWVSSAPPSSPRDVVAKIRYRHRGAPARVTPLAGGDVTVTFRDPESAITPDSPPSSTRGTSSSAGP